ncbi:uncharacterized protein [Elaeis guineensis]|uniref:uncharacterized protein isoform X2 n=1 Tax=Elaeis guineensis var. tenera TaxID=51953 RepID=UPI003C6D1669
MTLLCFLLDLRTIPPPVLRHLKQLANLYAVTSGRGQRERQAEGMPLLRDRLGLCYLHRGRSPSPSTELKIVYEPGQNFCLRDFHHAVNNLPMDSFMPEFNQSMPSGSGDQDISLTNLLTSKALNTWGDHHVPKKVIIVCTSLFANTEAIRKSLLGAAEQRITVEFVVLEQEDANVHYDLPEKLNGFINSISDLENCVLRRYLSDSWVMCGVVKRWLQELKDDVEEPLKAVFLFKNTIVGSVDQIYCNLFASSNQIVDGFPSCQTCRCHGYPIEIAVSDKKKTFCPLACHELGPSDLIDNAVRVGEQTVLFLPSFEGCQKLRRISAPITFSIIERTSLASLSEGVIVGTSYVVTPSDLHETEVARDSNDKSDLNTQLFHGLRGALFHLDQGLVCSSTCNTDTIRDGTFQCFYVLQPSDKGPMLLRRLAGSEDILPIPEISQANDHAVLHELEKSIQSSLSKIELRDYNPLLHERGFHPKLNWLVKESLQFGTILPRVQMSPKLSNPNDLQLTILRHDLSTQAPEDEIWPNKNKEEENSSCVTEWEQLLILDEMNDVYSSTCISNPKFQNSSLTAQTKPLDEKTSRILERLEAPKQQKLKATSPSLSRNSVNGQMKQPLVPFESSSSRPLRPSFQTLKRKQR